MPPSSSLAVLVSVLALNLGTWAIYRLDKRRAERGERRVPERTLLLLAAAGGIVGAFWAIYGHRKSHKARKAPFLVRFWAITLGWALLVSALLHVRFA